MRIVRGLWAGVAAVLPLSLPLLISAILVGDRPVLGRAAWLVGGFVLISVFANLAMAWSRPENLQMRRQAPIVDRTKKQPLVDAVGLVAFLAYLIGWMTFLPVDAARLHLLTAPPAWAAQSGLAAAMCGSAVSHLAIWQNVFATPAIQQQDGQRVIDTGLYGLVRHPLYAGNLLFFTGAALWMGSLAALAGVALILAATLARIVIEERYLRERLPDYGDYERRVRARLVPFLI